MPAGETGRIFVGHEMLFDGYTDGSPGRDMVEGMMTAGDLGHLDAEGRLFVDAREDDMIISGARTSTRARSRRRFARHPDVADVAVVGARTPSSASGRSRSSCPRRARS